MVDTRESGWVAVRRLSREWHRPWRVSGLLYVSATKLYQEKPSGPTFTHQQVVSLVKAGDTLTILGVRYGAGSRIAALSASK